MNMSDIRLVATDMDGTLLNSQGKVSEAFFSIFKKLQEHQIVFVAASGRQYYNLLKNLDSIRHDMIFIAENGSFVMDRDKELLVQALHPDVAKDLISQGRAIEHTYVILCGKKSAYIEDDDPKFIAHLSQYFEKYQIVENLAEVKDDDVLKVTFCNFNGTEELVYPHFKHLENDLKVKVSGHTWLDISDQKADKGRALKLLQQEYGISHEQTMAFGDYLNDLEMMEAAYFSYAMQNAHEEVKKTARFQAKSNDEDGVVQVLQQLINEIEK